MSSVEKQHLELMLHTLGLTDPFRKESARNHFVVGNGHSDLPAIMDLVNLGMMAERPAPGFLNKGDRVFYVTDAGKDYVCLNRKRPSLAKRRYHAYLQVADLCSDLTFKEWLTAPDWAESRARIE